MMYARTRRALKITMTALLTGLMTLSGALASPLPETPGAARTVKMFDLFCLEPVSDLDRIAEIANAGEFDELTGRRRDAYQPAVRAKKLRAWRFEDFGVEFALTTALSDPDAQFKQDVPAFAKSESRACSLIMPAADEPKAADILKEMTSLLTREPDEIWDQKPLRVHSWTGQTEDLLIIVYYYAPTQEGAKGLLSATTFVKN